MSNRKIEDIKRVLNQLNALLLASGDNIVLSNEFCDKLKEISSILENSSNNSFQALSEKISKILADSEKDESSKVVEILNFKNNFLIKRSILLVFNFLIFLYFLLIKKLLLSYLITKYCYI